MKMHYSHGLSVTRIEQIVGAFVIIPLVILAVVAFIVAGGQRLFAEKYTLRTTLSDTFGLHEGSPVIVSGIEVGRVKTVQFTKQGKVEVELEIFQQYSDQITQGAVAAVGKSGGLVGETVVEIKDDKGGGPEIPPGGTIVAEEPLDINQLLGQVEPMIQTVKATLERVKTITDDIHTVVQTGGRAAAHVEEATAKLPSVMDDVHRITTTVRRTVDTVPDMVASVRTILTRVDGMTQDVKNTTSKLPEVVDSVHGTVENVRTLTQDIKGVGKTVPPMMRSANATLQDVQTIVRGAKKTFPISVMVERAEGPAPPSGPKSLRAETLYAESR